MGFPRPIRKKKKKGTSKRIGRNLVFNTESMPSVDNQIQMLDACSYSPDPERISGGINTAHIVQACQESCITRTGDFLGDTTGNESVNCLQCIGPDITATTITATRMGILLIIR